MLHAQAGAFLPRLLEQAGLLEKAAETTEAIKEPRQDKEDAESAEEGRVQEIRQRYAETDEKILALNVVLVYKKVLQGLVYSPPDCDKYLALDAKPQVSAAALPPRLWPRLWHSAIGDWQRLREPVCKGKRT